MRTRHLLNGDHVDGSNSLDRRDWVGAVANAALVVDDVTDVAHPRGILYVRSIKRSIDICFYLYAIYIYVGMCRSRACFRIC
jgi:hypothetical protein